MGTEEGSDERHLTDIRILDGGFATQLGCHVREPIDGDVLWSARFLHTNPQAVIDTHLDFLRGIIAKSKPHFQTNQTEVGPRFTL